MINSQNIQDQLINGILLNDRAILSRAITYTESTLEEHQLIIGKVLENISTKTGNSIRIAISGIPGVGKSTFIEKIGLKYIARGKKVAVLAIDPSSSISKGSILGDKTRMEELAVQENAFIRPTSAGKTLGGVAKNTYETILLCEASGYDVIIIETVGVGQSEFIVKDVTDLFVLLQVPNKGDELQGIKRGIMECIDFVFINKVEENNKHLAKQLKVNLINALQFLPIKSNNWKAKVFLGSALNDIGIEEFLNEIDDFFTYLTNNKLLDEIRQKQTEKHTKDYFLENLLSKLSNSPFYIELEKEITAKVKENKPIPYSTINELINKIIGK